MNTPSDSVPSATRAEEVTSRPASQPAARTAMLALLLATAFWGFGFTWAKGAGEAINLSTGGGEGAPLGPIWVLCFRFLIAGVLWMLIFPAARRGWTFSLIWRALVLGLTLSVSIIIQHLGLDRTSEAVSAFLTSLTIIFVPLLTTFVLRKPPPGVIWIGVVVASAGVWLMTGASAGHFGLGELLGLGCALLYSIDIIAVNALVRPNDVSPITAAQFFVVALATGITCQFLPHGPDSFMPHHLAALFSHSKIGMNVLLLAVFGAMGAFGLQVRYQPHIDPTRAALIYLIEPIFASIYAWIAVGSRLGAVAILGAAMILLANVLVEILQSRRKAKSARAEISPVIID